MYNIETSIGFHLSKAARANDRRLDVLLAEYKLNRIMWATLALVGISSLSQPSRIADLIGIERSSVSRALTALRKLGLVEKSYDKTDGRMAEIRVTEQGRRVLRELTPRIEAHDGTFFGVMSEEDRARMMRLLRRLHEGDTQPSRI